MPSSYLLATLALPNWDGTQSFGHHVPLNFGLCAMKNFSSQTLRLLGITYPPWAGLLGKAWWRGGRGPHPFCRGWRRRRWKNFGVAPQAPNFLRGQKSVHLGIPGKKALLPLPPLGGGWRRRRRKFLEVGAAGAGNFWGQNFCPPETWEGVVGGRPPTHHPPLVRDSQAALPWGQLRGTPTTPRG